jgi:hypothetical protein
VKLRPEQRTAALATFSEYFVKNYPGPHTIIGDPNWHAPKIFRAALHAIESESTLETGTKAHAEWGCSNTTNNGDRCVLPAGHDGAHSL